ncbi:MAG: hypothetical protein AB7F19_06070 [Candidatus Babeliales bacterium]
MKNIVMSMAVVVGFSFVALRVQAATEKMVDNEVTFELYNKSKAAFKTNPTIKVYGGRILKGDIGSADKKTEPLYANVSRAQIRVDDASKFLIYLEILHPRGTYTYTIRPGHNKVLISFDPEKSPAVYPQTGPLKGLLGKTESGLSLKNNVSAAQITEGDLRSALQKIGIG